MRLPAVLTVHGPQVLTPEAHVGRALSDNTTLSEPSKLLCTGTHYIDYNWS